MIKVLREGSKKQIECDKCGALLEYTNEDIEEIQTSIKGYVDSIECPCCKGKIILRASR